MLILLVFYFCHLYTIPTVLFTEKNKAGKKTRPPNIMQVKVSLVRKTEQKLRLFIKNTIFQNSPSPFVADFICEPPLIVSKEFYHYLSHGLGIQSNLKYF